MTQFYLDVRPDTPENARKFFGAICDTLAALSEVFENVESELTLSACGARGMALLLNSVHQELIAFTFTHRSTITITPTQPEDAP